MTNSDIFKLAHKKTKLAKLKAALQGAEFSYQVTFSFYLKEVTNAQPMKYKILTNVAEQKQINIDCAMVGDYVKPLDSDKLDLGFFAMLSVFYVALGASGAYLAFVAYKFCEMFL